MKNVKYNLWWSVDNGDSNADNDNDYNANGVGVNLNYSTDLVNAHLCKVS